MVALNSPFLVFIWMSFLSIASAFLGLLLSSLVNTSEKAMTIVPLILIPQIMLAGLIAKVSSPLVEFLSYFTISRWGVEGFHYIQKTIVEDLPNMSGGLEPTKVEAIKFLKERFHSNYSKTFDDLAGTINLDIYVVTIMIFIMVIFTYKSLKKKDSVTI
tara:strand:- start:167 stop:643 length:477 start_codon:yes stop_codon:yes gene_type:complete